jgi:Icc-related predicted phosphoesterase
MSSSLIKICACSDLHGNLPDLPEADIVLIGGDITPYTNELMQAKWLDVVFRDWLNNIKGEVVAVAGNHDYIFEKTSHLVPKDLPWHYLQDSMVKINGLNIYGTPYQPRFMDWSFNADEPFLKRKWGMIPEDTDILLLHGPPLGVGDTVHKEHTGSPSLRDRILEIEPTIAVFGHIHEGRGVYTLGKTTCLNATLVDAKYEVAYTPYVVEMEIDDKGKAVKCIR